MTPRSPAKRAASLVADNRRMVGKLVVVAAMMFGFGYALVPIYQTICDVLGVNVLATLPMDTIRPAPTATSQTSSKLEAGSMTRPFLMSIFMLRSPRRCP